MSRQAIQDALKARLETITTANGYEVNVVRVYADDIPMAFNLELHEMPAIFILDDSDDTRHQQKQLNMSWLFRIQTIQPKLADSEVRKFQRAVAKAIWANHPTNETEQMFRMHPSITWVELGTISSDLNMLEANRVSEMEIIVHHRQRLFDL